MPRISAVQMHIESSVDRNLEKILGYMDMARGSDIVCFPETSLTGLNWDGYEKVEQMIHEIGNRSRSLSMWSVFGGYCQKGNNTFNEVYVVDRSGRAVHKYQKRHLWISEKGLTPGTENRVVDTDFGKIGVISCWDIAFAKDVRSLARDGAEIIFCPSYWYKPLVKGVVENHYYGIPNARAFENQVYLVFCDAISDETVGRSRILSPIRILAEAHGEEIISADIDLGELHELRKRYDCWK